MNKLVIWLSTHFARFGSGIICLTLISSLTISCSKTENNAIRFGLSSAAITLDPRYSTDAASTRIIRLLYWQLVDFNELSLPSPSLAKWTLLSPTHYRFKLREQGRNFHSGERLYAQDVKATYDSVLDIKTGSPHRQSLKIIKSIKIVNKNTIDFKLHHADPSFPGYLVIGIMPKSLIKKKHDFANSPIGSGPFRFFTWPDQNLLKLIRLHDNQLMEFMHIENSTTRVLKLLNNEIDILQNNLPGEMVKYLETFKRIKVKHRAGSNFSYLSFNFRDKRLRNLDLRIAIAHAIDRKTIIDKFFGEKTKLANAIFTPLHWAGHQNLEGYDYDPDKSRKLLAKHGYSKEYPLELTYKTTNKPFRVRIATLLQYQLAQVGVKVRLRTFEWTTFYNDIKHGNFELYSLTWVAVKSPDIFRYVYHSSRIPDPAKNKSGANRNSYKDEVTDYLIESAEKEQNTAKRIALYKKIHERLLNRLPVVPLWYQEHMFASRRNLFNYTLTHDGNFDSLVNVIKLKPGMKPLKIIEKEEISKDDTGSISKVLRKIIDNSEKHEIPVINQNPNQNTEPSKLESESISNAADKKLKARKLKSEKLKSRKLKPNKLESTESNSNEPREPKVQALPIKNDAALKKTQSTIKEQGKTNEANKLKPFTSRIRSKDEVKDQNKLKLKPSLAPLVTEKGEGANEVKRAPKKLKSKTDAVQEKPITKSKQPDKDLIRKRNKGALSAEPTKKENHNADSDEDPKAARDKNSRIDKNKDKLSPANTVQE